MFCKNLNGKSQMSYTQRALLLLMAITSLFTMSYAAPQPAFDKAKDLLLAQYDLANDEDDIHALAALGCVLTRSEWSNVKAYGVLGSDSPNQAKAKRHLNPTDLFDAIFGDGPADNSWTHRRWDNDASVLRVANLVQETIQNGGRVFVAEGGHYPFTQSWTNYLINQSMLTATQVKQKVFVVQHSQGNIDRSDGNSYQNVVNLTTHIKIGDGNRAYRSSDYSLLPKAISNSNPNAVARNLWFSADTYINNGQHDGISNDLMEDGGLDFSDFTEVRWILDIQQISTAKAFWDAYVTKGLTTTPPPQVDDILSIQAPEVVIVGQNAIVTVDYSASTKRQINVSFQLDTPGFDLYSSSQATVQAGQNSIDIII